MPRLHTANEVVMAIEIPVAAHLNEPGTTAGATSPIAGDGDHGAPPCCQIVPEELSQDCLRLWGFTNRQW